MVSTPHILEGLGLQLTGIAGGGLYHDAIAGDELAFLLSGLNHPLRYAILHRAAD